MQPAQWPMQVTEFTFNFSPDLYNNPFSNSSSTSSRPSSTTRYFDLLPPELIRHIFDFIQPASIVPIPAQHAKSQKTFRSLCLTSKRFLDLAHPYLYKTLCIPTFETSSNRLSSQLQLDPALAKANRMGIQVGKLTRTLFLDLRPSEQNVDALSKLIAWAEKLQTLYYIGNAGKGSDSEESEWNRFSCLQPFLVSNLRHLHLNYVTFPTGVPFSFPSLKELSLHQVLLPPLGTSYCLPSLRHLLYSSTLQTPEIDEFRYLATSAPRLASISFSLEHTIEINLANDTGDRGLDVLFAFNVMILPHDQQPVFAREHALSILRLTVEPNFTNSDSQMATTGVRNLQAWIDAIEGQQKLHSSLETLYLPGDLSIQRSYLPWGVRPQINRLVELCAKDRVEIVWEGITTDYNAERLVSREFADRAEQRKRARESEGWKTAGCT